MKMSSTRFLALFSIFCCLIVAESIEEISIVNDDTNADDFLEAFQQSLQSVFVPGSLHSDAKDDDTDQVYGYPQVNTKKGNIRGQTNDYAHSFYGIPYAEAPIGDLRYMPPVEKSFQADIEASQPNRVQCFQGNGEINLSEDCLVLNVYVPQTVNNETFATQEFDQLLPVMVWFHGGAFFFGSGTSKSYEGRFLSNSTNTVLVTINYRLGALGYLVFEEDGVAFNGNQGYKDQQLALKWVKDNIQNFGGDPDQVTIFGESAGAQSVMLHLASKVSKPYFKRCIMESNPAVYDYPTIDRAKLLSADLIGLLDCETDYGSNIECLRNVDAEKIVNKTTHIAIMALKDGDARTMVEPFRPVVDGDEFPKQPLAMFQEGNWNTDVDVIMGTNRDELGAIKKIFYDRNLRATFFKTVNEFLVGAELEPNVTAEYSKLVPPDAAGPTFDYTEIIAQEVGDLYFVCPSRLLARFIAQTSASGHNYLYSWDHASCDDPRENCHYASHGLEVRYVFNTRDYTGHFNGVEEQAISEMFSDFWGSFAHTGTPSSNAHDTWLKYELLTEESSANWKNLHMIYPRANMEDHYRNDICDFWDSLNYYVEIAETTDPNPTNDPSGGGGNASDKRRMSVGVLLLCFFFSYFS